jgi:hypothetical protein
MIIEKLRSIFLDMLNRQIKNAKGVSTRTNLYMVEVELLKDLFAVFTGMDPDEEADEYHDWVCNTLDELHHKFDN